MAKFTSVLSAKYDKKGASVRATLKDEDGKESEIEFDGITFAELMALASIDHLVFRHHLAGRALPLIAATGLQTGSVSYGDPKEYGMGLSLFVPQFGVLHFFLPGPVETALREKLKSGQAS